MSGALYQLQQTPRAAATPEEDDEEEETFSWEEERDESEPLVDEFGEPVSLLGKRPRKPTATGHMEPGGRLIVEDIQRDYQQARQNPAELERRFRPPYGEYVPAADLAEVERFRQEDERRRQRLAADPLWAFVRKVQAFTKKPMDALVENYHLLQQQTGTAGTPSFARNPAPTSRYLSVGERTPVGTGPNLVQRIAQQPPVFAQQQPGQQQAAQVTTIPPGINQELQLEQRQSATGERTAWDLVATQTHRDEGLAFVRKQRQFNALIELSQPENTGSILLSPMLEGAVDEARELVENTVLTLPQGLSAEVFMKDPAIQVAFARLVAFRIQLTDFFAPTRAAFDANEGRILREQAFLLKSMEAFRWLDDEERFDKRLRPGRRRVDSSSFSSSSLILNPTPRGGGGGGGSRLVLPRWT